MSQPSPSRPPVDDPAQQSWLVTLRLVSVGMALLAANLLLSGRTIPLHAVGMAAALAAAVLGVVVLVRSRSLQRKGAVIVSGILLLLMGGFFVMAGAGQLLLWPVVSDYQECLRNSLTLSGQAACQTQMDDQVQQYMTSLLPATSTGTASPRSS